MHIQRLRLLAVSITGLFSLSLLWPTTSNAQHHVSYKVSVKPPKNQGPYYSVKVPEGNYIVTLSLKGHNKLETLTVKAESRRLMAVRVTVGRKENKKISFVVNVKSPQIQGDKKVTLKPREVGNLNWDDQLTLEFSKPALVKAINIEKTDNQRTVYLAGNSTVVDQDEEPWASWGQMITPFFKPGVVVANHAASGLSLGSFLNSHRLDKILSMLKTGDYVFIEFGHNDQKEKGPADGAYGSYTTRLNLFIDKIKAKGGLPVLVTSTARRSFDENGKTINTLGDYPEAARKVARDRQVPLIDLNAMSTLFYDALGVEESKKAFVHYPANSFPGQTTALADNTHFSTYGAYQLAKCVLEGIKATQPELSKYIIDVPDYNPAQPDQPDAFSLPLSPKTSAVKPDGN
jgi:lysophospholipase L1-like esterase